MKLNHTFSKLQSTDEILPFLDAFNKHRSSFFTSTTWITQWLNHSQSTGDTDLLVFYDKDTPVGFIIFNQVSLIRRKFFKTTFLSLHDNDQPDFDFSIEYNELIIEPQFLEPAIESLLNFLSINKEIDDIKINASTSETYMTASKLICKFPKLSLITDESSICRLVNLKNYSTFPHYQQHLPKKRKYQLRKSEEYYGKYGAIKK